MNNLKIGDKVQTINIGATNTVGTVYDIFGPTMFLSMYKRKKCLSDGVSYILIVTMNP